MFDTKQTMTDNFPNYSVTLLTNVPLDVWAVLVKNNQHHQQSVDKSQSVSFVRSDHLSNDPCFRILPPVVAHHSVGHHPPIHPPNVVLVSEYNPLGSNKEDNWSSLVIG